MKNNFNEEWREKKYRAFSVESNSTAKNCISLSLFQKNIRIYSNANLSIYSAKECNANCCFCVEKLRPASRGVRLSKQKGVEYSDTVYFAKLNEVIAALNPLNPSVSITGGEPSKDPRLPGILKIIKKHKMRKRTVTTNGSGLLDYHGDRTMLQWIISHDIKHLNISRAHFDSAQNAVLMNYNESLSISALKQVTEQTKNTNTRVRLSCVLYRGAIESLTDIVSYLEFARSIGVDNVVFRQLMLIDLHTTITEDTVINCEKNRVLLDSILRKISLDGRFKFQHQILGYYYYVEVWKYKNIDVVFEEADLAQLEENKKQDNKIIHELIFHPNAKLASTWQPWDGIIY